jgi:excisionase family DNA binding protein
MCNAAVPLLMTVREAAGYLGRSEAFVRSLCHAQVIDSKRIGGRFYIYKAALDAWLEGPVDPEPERLRAKAPYVMPREW